MSMVVMHNIPALSAYNTVNRTSSSLQKSIQKLSTGLRINSAADDAAGLAISEKMRAQIRGLDRAVSNSQDGISMIQTAEGALNETHSILQRMRELSVQSANDTLTQQDRGYIQQEIDQLREEITRIGNTTQFNKKKLLNGDAAVLWSSDNLNTKAIINGGLRQVDQFGQKKAAEGNYKIKIKAEAGQGEIQKSDIFRIKHDLNAWNAKTNTTYGIASGDKQKAPEIKGGGLYTITGKVITPATTQNGAATLTSKTSVGSFAVAGGGLATLDTNANIKFKVESVDGNDIKLSYEGQLIGKDGKVAADPVKGTMTVTAGGAVSSLSIGGKTVTLGAAAGDAESFKAGDELVYNFSAAGSGDAGDVAVTIKGSPENGLMADHSFVINKKAAQDKELEFRVSYLETDPKNPEIK